jgi:hypothetical protein
MKGVDLPGLSEEVEAALADAGCTSEEIESLIESGTAH